MSNDNPTPSDTLTEDDRDQARYEKNEHAYAGFAKGRQSASILVDTVNGYDEKDIAKGFANQLLNSHRTLQACAVRTLLKALVQYASKAKENQFTDLRNEAAVDLLLKLRQTIIDTPIPFI